MKKLLLLSFLLGSGVLLGYFIMNSHQSLRLSSRPLNKSKVFIFDFDGTICNSYEAAMRAINNQAESFGYRKILPSEFTSMRNLTLQQVLKSVGISKIKLPFVVRKIRNELNKEIDSLQPFEGMRESLSELKAKGYVLGILTSNSEENVLRFIKRNNLELFDFIYSGSSLFGKARVINKLLKNLDIFPGNAFYVGDETRDIEAAKEVGIPIIAVTWGFNSKAVLETQHPEFLIDSVSNLKEF